MNLQKKERCLRRIDTVCTYNRRLDIAACVLLAASIIYYIFRACRGFGVVDESFYLTIPHRLLLGDSLFGSDWHVSQLSSFVQYLPMKIFVALTGSTDASVLFFRCLFIVCQSGVSAFTYIKLRKRIGSLSIMASLLFFFFLPMNIMTVSYYSESLMAAQLIGIILYTMSSESYVTSFITGVIFAFFVLSEPLMVFIYVFYTVTVIIESIKNKNADRVTENKWYSHPIFTVKSWLTGTAGIAVVTVAFFSFLFSRVSVSEILRNLPFYMTDSEYVFPFLSEGSQNFLDSLPLTANLIEFFPAATAILAIIVLIFAFDKRRREHRAFYMLIIAVWTVIYFLSLALNAKSSKLYDIFFRQLAVIPLGVFAYMFTEKKETGAKIFFAFSVMYAVILSVTTAITYVSAPVGYVVTSSAAIIMVVEFLKQEVSLKKANKTKGTPVKAKKEINIFTVLPRYTACVFALAALCTVFTAEIAIAAVSGTDSISFEAYDGRLDTTLDTVMTRGPMKGIRTSGERNRIYNGILDDLDTIKEATDGPVFVSELIPWTYLYLDRPYATYSAWYVKKDTRPRLTDYYSCYPEKAPDYVYVPAVNGYTFLENESCQEELETFTDWMDFDVTKTEFGYILKRVAEN